VAGILTRLAVEECDKLPHLAVGTTATAAGGKKSGLGDGGAQAKEGSVNNDATPVRYAR